MAARVGERGPKNCDENKIKISGIVGKTLKAGSELRSEKVKKEL